MSATRIGFIGGGTIARHHADALAQLDRSIAALADIDADTRRGFAADYDIDDTYPDHETMLREADLDVVVVAVPNKFHADCTIAALERDVDVFVEKPLATSYDSAAEIAAAERDSDGTVMVGFSLSFTSWFKGIEDRVSAGRLGNVYEVDAEYVRRRGIPQLGSWFTRKEIAGGGAMIDIGVHVLHLSLSLLGFPDIRSVSATTGSNFGTKNDYTYLDMWGGDPIENATFDVDDHTRALVHTEDGRTIHLHVAWASNSDPRHLLRVSGDEAGVTVRTGGGDPETTIHSTDGDALSTAELEHSPADPFVEEWRYFVDVVEGEREHTRSTVEEGLAVQELVDAIYESADRRTEITLTS